jgi:hypothetical protein
VAEWQPVLHKAVRESFEFWLFGCRNAAVSLTWLGNHYFCDGNLSTRGFSSAKRRSQLESTLALLSCHLQKPKVLPARRIAPKNRCPFDVGYSFKRDGYCCPNPLIQVGSRQLAQRCISAAARAKASGRCKRQIRYPVHMTCVLYPGV